MTATPACNSPDDLLSLLKLIVADDELERHGVPSISESFSDGAGLEVVLRKLVVRRLAEEVDVRVPRTRCVRLFYEPTANADEIRRRIAALTFPWMRGVYRDLLVILLERRLESSVAALAATIRRMVSACRRARHLAARGASMSAAALRRVLGDPEAGSFQDILFPDLWGADATPVSEDEMIEEAERLEGIAKKLRHDPKVELLMELVRKKAGVPGLVFTVSYDTASSLFSEMPGHLRCALLTGRRCVLNQHRACIDEVVKAMKAGELDLIVSTDVGGEGLNLETAGYVVHYDQPWNPAVLEQRTGRICRIGQTRDRVESYELVTLESRSRRIVRAKEERNRRLWAIGGSGDAVQVIDGDGWRPPGRLEPSRPEARLARILRARGFATRQVVELLSSQHRAGIERWMEDLIRRPLVGADVDTLRMILRKELELRIRSDEAN